MICSDEKVVCTQPTDLEAAAELETLQDSKGRRFTVTWTDKGGETILFIGSKWAKGVADIFTHFLFFILGPGKLAIHD
jgi:hypothetical protein